MKILSCYIEGYGKIQKKEYHFSDGLTTIFAENGEGKSTLASFLKAMFYGLKGYTKRSTEFCDREHFYPFEGGLFGGNLTFERAGKLYKIERFFGEKSETLDTLKVYCNGEETTELGEEIGKTVFGVDEESFLRTAFLDGLDFELGSTSSIHARLNRFLEGSEGDEDVDRAKAALEKAAKVYKKSRVGNDKITEENLRLMKLKESVENATTIKRALENKYAQSTLLQKELDELNARVVAAQKENELLSQFEHYDSLIAEMDRRKKALESILSRYPMGLPSEEETSTFNAYMGRLNELEIKLEGVQFSAKDEEKRVLLSQKFPKGLPSEESLLQVEGEIRALSEWTAKEEFLKKQGHSEKEGALRAKFALAQPSDELMDRTKKDVEEYKKLKSEAELTPAYSIEKKKEESDKKKYLLWAICSVAFCLLGGACLSVNLWLGCALLIVGGVTLFAVGFAYLNKKTDRAVGIENPERQKLQLALREKEDAIKAVLLPYGYHSGNGILFDFATLQSDLFEFTTWQQSEEKRLAERERIRQQLEGLTVRLTAFFWGYGLAGDTFIKLLSDLRVECNEYLDLSTRQKLAKEGAAALEQERIPLRAYLDTYRQKYRLQELSAVSVLEDIRNAERLQREIAEGNARASEYKTDKGLGEKSTVERVDLASLQSLLSEKQNERNKLEREIADDEREAENLEGYETEKTQAEEKLAAYKTKHRLLTATGELLARAEGRLRDKYVKPIREEFLHYAELIERTLGEKIVMTKDFEIRFERNGVERSEKHLSDGQRSICSLCFRLALLKNMYEEQLPFLILDDPFVGLDAKHLERVKGVLQELSKEMQMLYFTCHESRKM